MIVLLVVPTQVLPLVTPTSLTPRRPSWAVSRLDCVSHYRSAMNSVTRLRHYNVLLSGCLEQRSDLHQTSTSFRLGRLNRLYYAGCSCKVLDRSAVYLWFRREQLPLPSTRFGDLPSSTR